MTGNPQVLIASVPDGPLVADHFELHDGDIPVCDEGQVLCRTMAHHHRRRPACRPAGKRELCRERRRRAS
jgi:hypothetical protein